MYSLGERLKEAREKKGMTQMQVAKKLGITNGAISCYERKYRDPDTETLRKLADLYEVNVDWLTGGKEVKKDNDGEEISEWRKKAIEEIYKMSDEEVNYFYDLMKRIKK